VSNFHAGRVILGQCAGARLPVPIYETAFALARALNDRGERERVKITVVSPGSLGSEIGDEAGNAIQRLLKNRQIEFLPDFSINSVSEDSVTSDGGRAIKFDLLMLLPPFRGSSAASYLGITNPEGYINVDRTMRVIGHEGIYAVGDCVNFYGPKMGHMAARQGDVAAANLAAEIEGHEPASHYVHEMRLVIDDAGSDSIYLHKNIWTDAPATLKQGRFWSWAKRAQKEYWEVSHS
jgi:sulfide:quinone oxidoreductase